MMAERSIAQRAIRRHLLAGLSLVAFLSFGLGGWAATTPLAGAIVSTGTLVVNSHVKKVQHPTGGVVSSIQVANGSTVEAGDVLLRIDETQIRANLAIVERRLVELTAREARLATESGNGESIDFGNALKTDVKEVDVQKALNGERQLFAARQSFRNGQKAQLSERMSQLQQEIQGLEAQVVGKDRETILIQQELEGVQQLLAQGLMQVTRVNSLEREAARLTSERGALIASIAQAKGKIAEIQLQRIQIDEDLQRDVATELREVSAQIGEFDERRAAALDQLKRTDLRAPQAGIVHELAIHTADAVLLPGEVAMLIVPVSDELEAEIRIAPQDIDQLVAGQIVNLRFSAFHQGTTPEVEGTITYVGADLTHAPPNGLSYYLARVRINALALAQIGNIKLVPGMPVEAFIKTEDRSVLSYLTKPLMDQIERAFKE